MTKATDTEITDLGKLARKRARDAVLSVIQLLDTPDERAAMLIWVAIDFLRGASIVLADSDDDLTNQDAFIQVLGMMFDDLGIEVAVKVKGTKHP